MDNINRDIRSIYNTYGNGKAIIEILNIGFEPLLTHDEYVAYKKQYYFKRLVRSFTIGIQKLNSFMLYTDDMGYLRWLRDNIEILSDKLIYAKQELSYWEDKFRCLLKQNTKMLRVVNPDYPFSQESQFRNIKIFESDLTRCFGCRDMEHTDSIISVVTYFTEIFDSLIHQGFIYKGQHYVFFTAGAGQTRCKKSTFVLEDQLAENADRLFCGLSQQMINDQGGMNTNKYLAYTSLCQTNSEIWHEFNIDRAIVVDDIEFTIPDQTVRYIYTESPEDKKILEGLKSELESIKIQLQEMKLSRESNPGVRRSKAEVETEKRLKQERKRIMKSIDDLTSKYHTTSIKTMGVNIPFTDGFGISLKKMESSMIRLPFIKGLMAYCPKRAFVEWCQEHHVSIHKVTDIYGKTYSINEIDYIFTKSQFKMWKYYNNIYDDSGELLKTGWEIYRENFKRYGCDACRCNVEKKVTLNAKTNYQILQTLTTEMTDDDIKNLAEYDIENINGIGRDIQCMLNVLGANEERNGDRLNWLQKSLILYPEMLRDFYIKTLLKNTKDSMVRRMRSGKFSINGAYTFAIPDTLACMQWWFTDMDKTVIDNFGFIKPGYVSCKLITDNEEVDCLRSPHLDHAHCIRINRNDGSTRKWTKSFGVYIGMHDTMSKLLMYDNDGDKLLIHNNRTIIKCAKSFQDKYGMIPNYYDMPKANPEILSSDTIFKGIITAYHHANIGTPSNEITKIFATLDPESSKADILSAIEIVALRCVDVNFTIDFAKTLYKPTVPNVVAKKYKMYSNHKVPHFFVYAKNKTESQVEPIGTCNIDRISSVVKSNRIVFKDVVGKYSYKNLMQNPDVSVHTETANKIINLYQQLEDANMRKLSHLDLNAMGFEEKNINLMLMEYDTVKQRDEFVKIIGKPVGYIVDVLIKFLKDSISKGTLWRLFGDVIYGNLTYNLYGTKLCKICHRRFEYNTTATKEAQICQECYTKSKRKAG